MGRPDGSEPDAAPRARPGRAPGRLWFVLSLAPELLFALLPPFRALVWRLESAAVTCLASVPALLRVDGPETLKAVWPNLLRLLPTLVPLVVYMARLRGRELLKLPRWIAFLPALVPIALTVNWSAPMTILLVGAAAGALWLMRAPRWRWTGLLPVVLSMNQICIHLLPLHFKLPYPVLNLPARCQANDGARPDNLDAERLGPFYYAPMMYDANHLLLAYAGPVLGGPPARYSTSWWLKRQGSGWTFDRPSRLHGIFEAGCRIGDRMWMNDTDSDTAYGIAPDPHGGDDSIVSRRLHLSTGDLPTPVCRPEAGQFITSENFSGNRVWALSVQTGEVRLMGYEPGALLWDLHDRGDGRFIITDTSRVSEYDLRTEKVVQKFTGAVFLGRAAVCPRDKGLAVADLLGRVRFFKVDAAGRYAFDGGVSSSIPYKLAFSPDCRYLGVTSGDDSTITVIDREERRVVKVFHVGPALRSIAFLGPRELAITDACTLTTFHLP